LPQHNKWLILGIQKIELFIVAEPSTKAFDDRGSSELYSDYTLGFNIAAIENMTRRLSRTPTISGGDTI